jgi:hypothetical protein
MRNGCPYPVPFPATSLAIYHQGNMLTVTPSGGTYPGNALTGTEEPPPAAPHTFVVRATTPNETQCSLSVATSHSVRLVFSSATLVSGAWTKIYDATGSCTMASCANCSCAAGGATTGAFNGIKQ